MKEIIYKLIIHIYGEDDWEVKSDHKDCITLLMDIVPKDKITGWRLISYEREQS